MLPAQAGTGLATKVADKTAGPLRNREKTIEKQLRNHRETIEKHRTKN
jgi:hypothetical protein